MLNATSQIRVASLALLAGFCSLAQAATLDVSIQDKTGAPLADVVVYLDLQAGKFPPVADGASTTSTVSQAGMQFSPYVTPLRVGAKVSFVNPEKMEHHVKSFSAAKEFEINVSDTRTPPPILFDKAGVVAVVCTLHDWMRGYVYVVDTPYFARTDETGAVTITNIPPGKYVVRAWHPDFGSYLPPLEQPLAVANEVADTMHFDFPLKPKKRRAPKVTN